MEIDFTAGLFVARCTFGERLAFANGGWRWDNERKRWVTDDAQKAQPFVPFATDAAVQALGSVQAAQMGALALSYATDYPIAVPAPPGLAYDPHQKAAIYYASTHRDTLCADPPGLGKGGPLWAKVLTPTGWTTYGDLSVGDRVIGSSGAPCNVTGVFDRGILPIFKVSFSDGSFTHVDGEHLWAIRGAFYTKRNGEHAAPAWRTLSTKMLINKLNYPCGDTRKFRIPVAGPVQFDQDEKLTIPAYTLGVILGDGGEFIPDSYLFSSVPDRIALLQGLLDTDGHAAKDGTIKFSSNSERLVDGVIFLCQTLGSLGRKTTKISASGKDHYTATLCFADGIKPFTIQRKLDRITDRVKYPPTRIIRSIEAAGETEVRCISVDAPDHLYLTDACIVTHNTIIGVGLSNYLPEIRNVLIVTPLHLKLNWQREWRKWCVKGLTVGIAGSVIKRARAINDDGTKARNALTGKPVYRQWAEKVWPATEVVIINYDQLPDFAEPIRAMLWDLLICDESHYLMTATSERTRNVLGGGKSTKKRKVGDKIIKARRPPVPPIPADRRLFLTGTPITGRPMNLWPVCEAFDPDGLGKNWRTFGYRYCDGHMKGKRFDTSGASDLDELQVKARLKFMIRRDKQLVMKSLPPLRRQLIELPAEGLAKLVDREVSAMWAVRDALATFERDLRGEPEPAEIDWPGLAAALERRFGHLADLDYLERFKMLTPPEKVAFEELSTARKDLAAAKIPMIVEHLHTWLDAGEKVITFVVHTELAEALRERFPGCGFITGRVPAPRRQAEVDRFQEDDACRLMVANYVAGGTGYTMTASNIVVCAELEWSPYLIEQAEARAWRRGQQKSVLSQHLVVEGSSDARLVEVMLEKQTIVKEALDFDALSKSPLLFRA